MLNLSDTPTLALHVDPEGDAGVTIIAAGIPRHLCEFVECIPADIPADILPNVTLLVFAACEINTSGEDVATAVAAAADRLGVDIYTFS
jgi:hypothetical protein